MLVRVRLRVLDETLGSEVFSGEKMIIPGLGDLPKELEEEVLKSDSGSVRVKVPRDPSLVVLVPMKYFIKNGVKPRVGLKVEVDGNVGRIVSISGGRILVDFNPPYSGHTLLYEFEVLEKKKGEEAAKDYLKEVLGSLDGIEIKDGKIFIRRKIDPNLLSKIKEAMSVLGFEVSE